jgi:hypothetical protein
MICRSRFCKCHKARIVTREPITHAHEIHSKEELTVVSHSEMYPR